MVDVVLLLIIFFLLASKFKGEEAELLSLPFAREAIPAFRQGPAPQFIVNIAPALLNGQEAAVYIYQGMPFGPEEMERLPREMRTLTTPVGVEIKNVRGMGDLIDEMLKFKDIFNEDGRLVIRADRHVIALYVLRFQDKCAGIKNVQYATSVENED